MGRQEAGKAGQASEIRALTGLRGAAALMVLAVHATPVLAPDAPARLAATLAHGQVAVDLFFVLSGFVLARAQAGLGRAGVAAFLWRRAWRIVPLHAAVLGALAACVLAALRAGDGFIAPDFPWSRLLPTLLLLQPFLFHGATGWNPPDWSVAVETLCSLLLWPALVVLRAIGWPRLVAGVLALAAAANLMSHGGETAGWPAVLRGACGFGFGMALARLAAAGRLRGAWACGTGAELAAGGGFLAAVAADVPAASVVMAGWLVAALSREAGAVSRLLRGRAMTRLGRVSFSIYLVHVPLLIPFEGGWAWAGGWAGRLAACGAYLALVAGVAALAERWVERPGRAMAEPARRWLLGIRAVIRQAGKARGSAPGPRQGKVPWTALPKQGRDLPGRLILLVLNAKPHRRTDTPSPASEPQPDVENPCATFRCQGARQVGTMTIRTHAAMLVFLPLAVAAQPTATAQFVGTARIG